MRVCFQLVGTAGILVLAAAAAELHPTRVASIVLPDARTGKLVRSMVAAPRAPRTRATPAPAARPEADIDLNSAVDRIARQNDVPAQLVHSVIKVESNYNPFAVSPKGAMGIMQLVPATARRFGVRDIFDPVDNIQGGVRYLGYLLQMFGGDSSLALAAYNAGEGAVLRYGGIPPYAETRGYVSQVRQRFETSQPPAAMPGEGNTAEAPPAEVYRPIHEVTDADGRVFYVSE